MTVEVSGLAGELGGRTGVGKVVGGRDFYSRPEIMRRVPPK